MLNRVIGISVIGGGRAGIIHARNFLNRVSGARLMSVAEPIKQQRLTIAAELPGIALHDSTGPILSDTQVDAIVIATPTDFHKPLVIAAAKAGKHILCEKPMAMNALECREMIDATDRANVKLQIGFMRRFDAGFIDAHQRLAAGEIGNVVMVRSLTHGPNIPKPWMYNLAKSNGPLAEVNSHDIDSLRWFTGSEFAEVYAVAGNYRSPNARESFPDFYDNVCLTATFVNGMQGIITGAQGVRYGYDSRCEILGERGLIAIGDLRAHATTVYHDGLCSSPVVSGWMNLFDAAYLAEDQDFVACIREDRSPRCTGLDGLEAVRVVLAGNQSIREKRPIRLERGA